MDAVAALLPAAIECGCRRNGEVRYVGGGCLQHVIVADPSDDAPQGNADRLGSLGQFSKMRVELGSEPGGVATVTADIGLVADPGCAIDHPGMPTCSTDGTIGAVVIGRCPACTRERLDEVEGHHDSRMTRFFDKFTSET